MCNRLWVNYELTVGTCRKDKLDYKFTRNHRQVGVIQEWTTIRTPAGRLIRRRLCTITVPYDWLSQVFDRGMANLGHRLTLTARLVESKRALEMYEAVWARRGRNHDAVIERGALAVLRGLDGGVLAYAHLAQND